MIGIRQQHLRAQLFQLILGNGLYRPPRTDRHEGGRFNLAVRGAEHSGTRAGSLILRDNFESFRIHEGNFIARIEKAGRVVASENKTSQIKWQAAKRPGLISRNSGSSLRQRSSANGQRGW